MPSLDLNNAAGGGQKLLRLDRGGRAVVSADARVLEGLGELQKSRRAAVGERHLGSRHGLTAKLLDRGRESAHVLGLVLRNQVDEGFQLAARLRLGLGLVVERRLQVLERQGEVEDFDIPAPGLGEGLAQERPDHRQPVYRSRSEGSLHDHVAAAHLLDLDGSELGIRQLLVLHCFFLSHFACHRLGDDVGLDRLQNGVRVGGHGKGPVGGYRVPEQGVEGRRVPGFNGVNRKRRGEHLRTLDVRRLA